MAAATEFAWNWKLAAGTTLCFLGGALCAGSGIGGGAFYLSAFILILGLDAHGAVPLSKVTILGLAIGGLFVLVPRRHPKSAMRALIDYDIAMVLQPTVLLGSVGGVFLNVVSPTWLIVGCLVAIFAHTSYRAIKKGIDLRKKERSEAEEQLREQQEVPMIAQAETAAAEVEMEGDGSVPKLGQASAEQASGCFSRHRDALVKGLVMLAVIAGMFLFIFLKGGTSGTSAAGVVCGSPLYWGLVAAIVPYMLAIAGGVIWWQRKHGKRVLFEGDIVFTPKQTAILFFGGIFAGVISSFLGVGGGIVVGPLLLELGLVPQVATATSSFMLVFMAMSSTFQYLIVGKLPLFLALWYSAVGFASAIVGQLLVVWLVKKTRKQSLVNFILAAIIVLSCVAFVVILVFRLINDVKTKTGLWFTGICIEEDVLSSSLSSF